MLTASHMKTNTIIPLISLAAAKDKASFIRYPGFKLKFLKTISLLLIYANATARTQATIVAIKLERVTPMCPLRSSFTTAKAM